MEILFCVVKFGIKTNVPIFKSVAGVKRELIWLIFDKFNCVFYLYLKSIRNLILKFVDDESGLHHEYVVVSCIILNLYLVDNNLVRFYWRLL